MVTVGYQDQEEQLSLLVVEGNGPSLLGRDWLRRIRLSWKELLHLQSSPPVTLADVLNQHADVFRDELGTVKGSTARIHVDPEVQPWFCRPRPVPYALRNKVEVELECLEREGVMNRCSFGLGCTYRTGGEKGWMAPFGSAGTIKSVSKAAKVDSYPLLRINDLFASLSGGLAFSKQDLAHAYQQLPLEDSSRQLVMINTHRGLYRYNRLSFGVSPAPAIFQRTMENLLQGIPKVCVYIDDILVTGASEEEHLGNLNEVLTRLETAGMRLKRHKCAFLLPEVEYLGQKITPHGLQPTAEKVRAIVDAPRPQNVSQLKSFLGLLNYYGKFLPRMSTTLAPLYSLLQKQTRWSWGCDQQSAFIKAKDLLASSRLLVHYDPEKKLLWSCDASPYGVGAVLSHQLEDGSEQPIAFASRSLPPADRDTPSWIRRDSPSSMA